MNYNFPPMKKMLEVDGRIVSTHKRDIFNPRYVRVVHNVGGEVCTKNEKARYTNRNIRIFGISVCAIKEPLLGSLKIGNSVRVHYIDEDQHCSYLPDNVNWDGLLRR